MNHYIDKFNRSHLQTLLQSNVKEQQERAAADFKWDAAHNRITNVGHGVHHHDVSTIDQTVNYHGNGLLKQGTKRFEFIEKDDNRNAWKAKKIKITDLAEGVGPDDAVNVGQVITASGDSWDVKDKELTNLKWARQSDSAATLGQCEFHFLKTANGKWNCKDRPLSKVGLAVEPTDALTLSQFKDIESKVLVYDPVDNKFKCGNKTFDLVVHKPGKPLTYCTVKETVKGKKWDYSLTAYTSDGTELNTMTLRVTTADLKINKNE